MRPLLKWAGGKSRLAADVEAAFGEPCRGTYYEPFAGSLAVYLARRAAGTVGDALLSDVNGKLIETHRAIRDDVDGVLAEIQRLPAMYDNAVHLAVRDAFNAGPHAGPAHAARFLWLNRTCYNGLYRESSNGYNVPSNVKKGRPPRRVRLPSESRFREVSDALQSAGLLVCSFHEAMSRAGDGDQVYADPPYVPIKRTGWVDYTAAGFGPPEQVALAQLARGASARGARVVLSNHDVPWARELYAGCAVTELDVGRSIGRTAGSRRTVRELLARPDSSCDHSL